jgi:predicted negative regulator of RcsB-dependent stress response
MSYDLQEQEQLDAFKAWWKTNGNWVSGAASIVLAAILAYQGWNWYSLRKSAEASAMYDQFERATTAKDAARAKELAGSLIEQHGSTVYAALAALRSAKSNVDASDRNAAKSQLRWVVDHASQKELALLARVRLAGVLLDEKAFDEALQVLKVDIPDAFATEFADRRGDVLLAQGKPDLARAAYTEALAKAGPQQPLRALIQLKIDALPAAGGA